MRKLNLQILSIASTVALWIVSSHYCYAGPCDLDQADEQVNLSYIHDGDTFFTNDGRKIRIIGLDTPELARENKPAEPYATVARDFLRQLAKPSARIQLRFSPQKQDRYKRLLADVFLGNGDNVTEKMLEAGLATALIIPPNIRFADCYLAAQERARANKLGIWQRPELQVTPLAKFNPANAPQYRLLTGTITSLQKGPQRQQIRVKDGNQELTLIIKNSDKVPFQKLLSENLIHKQVLVQGWINIRKGQLRVYLRHPGFIKVLSD